ncbi:MAG TPA: sigma-70 family RNA polymerase sigma factor [Candidatus Acidoferrum sp.]|nr:sigma-70 family RNA polymerase sigma factor [Candidatus Acidoferrum sp.]
MVLDADVVQLRRGDLDALTALIARFQNRLYRYLLRIVREPAEAEDLFQQCWLRVAEKIQSYDPNRSFDSWLFAVARNLAFDHLRRVRPRSLDEPLSKDESSGSFADRIPSKDILPLERILESERSGKLAEALSHLPVSSREILSLRFEEEMKLEEIARLLGTPLSTVKTRLRRSLGQLRNSLQAGYFGGEPS